ncbi:conjugal transfer protein TraB [Elizabethkingia anophelis]|nr:conjugal transfer protein TraB [Elizabethkingia anophelis]
MITDNPKDEFKKTEVDEDYLMNIMSGDEPLPNTSQKHEQLKENKPREKQRSSPKKMDFEETFLINRFPSGRSGKVVYIRPEYHERLLRIVQLTREEKTTLYSYIDNILQQHFQDYGADITRYFNEHFKPII